jgi:hypothetical protein
MPSTWLIEIIGDNSERQHGLYEFTRIPNVGDQISLRSDGKTRQVYGVAEVEHYPAPLLGDEPATEPSVTIYVHWLEEAAIK